MILTTARLVRARDGGCRRRVVVSKPLCREDDDRGPPWGKRDTNRFWKEVTGGGPVARRAVGEVLQYLIDGTPHQKRVASKLLRDLIRFAVTREAVPNSDCSERIHWTTVRSAFLAGERLGVCLWRRLKVQALIKQAWNAKCRGVPELHHLSHIGAAVATGLGTLLAHVKTSSPSRVTSTRRSINKLVRDEFPFRLLPYSCAGNRLSFNDLIWRFAGD